MALTEEQKMKLQEKMRKVDASVDAPVKALKRPNPILKQIGIVALALILFLIVDVAYVKKASAWNGESFNPLMGPVVFWTNYVYENANYDGGYSSHADKNLYTLFGYCICIHRTHYIRTDNWEYELDIYHMFTDISFTYELNGTEWFL